MSIGPNNRLYVSGIQYILYTSFPGAVVKVITKINTREIQECKYLKKYIGKLH